MKKLEQHGTNRYCELLWHLVIIIIIIIIFIALGTQFLRAKKLSNLL